MISSRSFLAAVLCAAFFSSLSLGQDFSKYRDFQFGMNIESVAKQIQMKASDAKTSYQRPAVIQTLQWDQVRYSDATAKAASLRSIRFDFYSGELSKMVVTYDPAGTEGLTVDDVIEAISALYGTATKPADSIAISNSTTYEDQQKVLARWEDAQYSYNLFRSSYGSAFGLVGFSKKLDLMAGDSRREADRLDKLEAPAKELARQMKLEEDARTAQQSARSINKPKFQP